MGGFGGSLLRWLKRNLSPRPAPAGSEKAAGSAARVRAAPAHWPAPPPCPTSPSLPGWPECPRREGKPLAYRDDETLPARKKLPVGGLDRVGDRGTSSPKTA